MLAAVVVVVDPPGAVVEVEAEPATVVEVVEVLDDVAEPETWKSPLDSDESGTTESRALATPVWASLV